MPKPNPSKETKEEFLERCMAYPDHQDLDPKVRYAKCNGMWDTATKLSDLYMADFEPPEAGDAPKGVRDILDSAYSSCRNAWTKENPDDKENQANKTSCARQAWAAVKNAGWRKDAEGNWRKVDKMADMKDLLKSMIDGEFEEINNVEILNQYENAHGLNFTDEDMDEILMNYQQLKENKELTPNVKISHSDQQLIMQEIFGMSDVEFGEELPNVGILDNFKLKTTNKGKALFVDIKKIPKMLKRIYGGLYTSLSPEIVRNWRGELGKVVRGIVLSNNPSQKHIPDVYAMSTALSYDGNIIIIDQGGEPMGDDKKKDQTVTLSDDQLEKAVLENENVLVKLADKMKGLLGIKKDDKKSTDDDKKKKKDDDEDIVKLSKADFEEMKKGLSEINELKKKLIEKDEATVSLSDAVAQIKKDAQKEKAEAICSKAKNDGVPTVIVEKLKPILLSDMSEKTIKLSHMVDDEMVEADVSVHEIIKDVFDNFPSGERIDMTDRTSTDITPPSEDKMKKINARKKEYIEAGDDEHTALTKAGRDLLK